MQAWRGGVLILGLAAAVLAGCGGAATSPISPADQGQPHISGQAFPQTLAAAADAVAEAADFHGAKALRLSNGLVTVIAVPAAGGRILSYQLGKHEFLWADASLYGKTGPSLDFGGDRALVIAEDKTDTSALNGAWTGSVTTGRGVLAEVTLVSPADPATGLQITRVLSLDAGSTHLRVADTLKNTSAKSVKVSLGTSTDALGGPAGKSPGGQVRAYLPASAASGHTQGFWSLQGTELGTLLSGGGIVEIAAKGQAGRTAVHDAAGWLALSDATDSSAYVRRWTVSAEDSGATAEVASAAYASGKGGYLTLVTHAPAQDLGAGKTLTFSQDWYATTVAGPILGTSEVAAENQPPALKAQGGQMRLTGRVGVFAPGSVVVSLLDASGQQMGTPVTQPAGPDKPVTVDQTLSVAAATTVRVALQNGRGTLLGSIAELNAR